MTDKRLPTAENPVNLKPTEPEDLNDTGLSVVETDTSVVHDTSGIVSRPYHETVHGWVVTIVAILVLGFTLFEMVQPNVTAHVQILFGIMALIIVSGIVYAVFGHKPALHRLFKAMKFWRH